MTTATIAEDMPLFAAAEQRQASYPQEPGHKHTDTSLEAADSIAHQVNTLRAQCLDILRRASMTADEVAGALAESILTIRPRIAELRRLGMIADTGARRQNASGRNAIVWQAISTCVDKTRPDPHTQTP